MTIALEYGQKEYTLTIHNGLTTFDDLQSGDRNPSVLSTLLQWLGCLNLDCRERYAKFHPCQANASNGQARLSTSQQMTY